VSGKKIVVLGTGGTLAGRASGAHDNLAYTAGQVGIEEILRGIPALAGVDLAAEQVAQLDSKDMDLETWRRLALRCAEWEARPEVGGLVVTHGTDTLEETAFFLQEVLAPAKPVVITGAMRPASSADADGPRNLVDAVCVATADGPRGVVVAFAGALHVAQDVAKAHPYRLDAFTSGDAGPLGYVEEGRLRVLRPWAAGDAARATALLAKLRSGAPWPRVEIVLNHAGASGAIVDALVAQGVRGIVAAGTGNGTLHQDLAGALQRAQAAGVRVVRGTRCSQGQVLGHAGDALPHSEGLSPVKARIRLMLDLLA
jgi:L-asparaginase